MKQESTFYKRTNSSEHDIEEKQEIEANKVRYNTQKDISEEHECFMKKRSVSLSQIIMIRCNLFMTSKENKTKLKTKQKDAPRITHNGQRNKNIVIRRKPGDC